MNTKKFSISVLSIAALSLTGCGGGGDKDTATTDTGTNTTVTNTTDTSTESQDIGHYGTIDCTDFIYDVYNVPIVPGDELVARIDTVAAETTFDPVLMASWGEGPVFTTYIKWNDDDFKCAYSPEELFGEVSPAGYCPQLELTAQAGGDMRLIVDAAQWPCAGDIAEYYMTVQLNGEYITPELIWDNYLEEW
jgi:hypothetical protein